MNYVILDIEWIVPTSPDDLPELIEIAAIKVKEVDGLLLKGEEFHRFIRPSHRKVNTKTVNLTGVKNLNLYYCDSFPKTMGAFLKWLGKERYLIYTWGQQDQLVLEKNCKIYNIGTNWLVPYKDFQQEFIRAIRVKRQVGFQQALQIANVPFEGKKHSAITHAKYACEMFIKFFSTFIGRDNQLMKPKVLKVNGKRKKKKSLLEKKIPHHLARSREKGLYSSLCVTEFKKVLSKFNHSCALTGNRLNMSIDHFIPLAIGHGGTYAGNVYPLNKELNGLKANQNPFEWIMTINNAEIINYWNILVQYLAELHGLGIGEFINYVYWCFNNSRTKEEIQNNPTLASIELWRKSGLQIKDVHYYTRRGNHFFYKLSIEKEGKAEFLRVKCTKDVKGDPQVVGFQSSIVASYREVEDIARMIKYDSDFNLRSRKLVSISF
ncbi:3'-5' exonuclease [Brevibacillus choshinensis]|uniref:3'-5' exonuclease n=1 Tax=Brevibacillus choshinensis TaxID=54911 RepID=UPI002E1C7A15|nr:exonuclease domain-containing protein [Brevibacillus choshinensis]